MTSTGCSDSSDEDEEKDVWCDDRARMYLIVFLSTKRFLRKREK